MFAPMPVCAACDLVCASRSQTQPSNFLCPCNDVIAALRIAFTNTEQRGPEFQRAVARGVADSLVASILAGHVTLDVASTWGKLVWSTAPTFPQLAVAILDSAVAAGSKIGQQCKQQLLYLQRQRHRKGQPPADTLAGTTDAAGSGSGSGTAAGSATATATATAAGPSAGTNAGGGGVAGASAASVPTTAGSADPSAGAPGAAAASKARSGGFVARPFGSEPSYGPNGRPLWSVVLPGAALLAICAPAVRRVSVDGLASLLNGLGWSLELLSRLLFFDVARAKKDAMAAAHSGSPSQPQPQPQPAPATASSSPNASGAAAAAKVDTSKAPPCGHVSVGCIGRRALDAALFCVQLTHCVHAAVRGGASAFSFAANNGSGGTRTRTPSPGTGGAGAGGAGGGAGGAAAAGGGSAAGQADNGRRSGNTPAASPGHRIDGRSVGAGAGNGGTGGGGGGGGGGGVAGHPASSAGSHISAASNGVGARQTHTYSTLSVASSTSSVRDATGRRPNNAGPPQQYAGLQAGPKVPSANGFMTFAGFALTQVRTLSYLLMYAAAVGEPDSRSEDAACVLLSALQLWLAEAAREPGSRDLLASRVQGSALDRSVESPWSSSVCRRLLRLLPVSSLEATPDVYATPARVHRPQDRDDRGGQGDEAATRGSRSRRGGGGVGGGGGGGGSSGGAVLVWSDNLQLDPWQNLGAWSDTHTIARVLATTHATRVAGPPKLRYSKVLFD